MFHEIETKEILVLGCGNVLFGDDAFGPKVIERFEASDQPLPEWVFAEDVGTSVRDILFNVGLAPKKPSLVMLVDAVQVPEREPGEVFVLDIGEVPAIKSAIYSFHQCPTSSLLRELRDEAGIDVIVIAGQAAHIPESVEEGMSPPMEAAVDRAVTLIRRLCEDRSPTEEVREPCSI